MSGNIAVPARDLHSQAADDAAELYIDLLKKVLSRYILGENYKPVQGRNFFNRSIVGLSKALLHPAGFEIVRHSQFNAEQRAAGLDVPPEAETMIGMIRLNNLQTCVTALLRERVAGDLIETGVWRGGASIFMRGILKAYGDTTRKVWCADSFEGLPVRNRDLYPADKDPGLRAGMYCAHLDEVKRNFERYNLLDDQVQFLVGWFRDTLPGAPITKLALLRLDGDFYESTMDALINLYGKLSMGGYVIIDDYCLPACRAAVEDFRAKWGIQERLYPTEDNVGAYWKRTH